MRQIALDLHLHEAQTLENFYAEERNKNMMIHLHMASSGRGENMTYIWGPSGVGRTHLLKGCCHTANRLGLSERYLSLKSLDQITFNVFKDLEHLNLICIDDLDGIVGMPEWEEAFFHCFNRIQDAKKRLVVAGSLPPKSIGMVLPDLISRLSAGMIFQIYQLTEENKIKALMQCAQKKGFDLPFVVARFLFYRVKRDLGSLFSILDQLDEASLSAKHKITIPFVKEVLEL